MPEKWQLIGGIAWGAGLLLGIPVARRSHQDNKVYTAAGHVFNYLAAVMFVALPLNIIVGLVFGNVLTGAKLAIGDMGAVIVFILLHAIPESLALRGKPASARKGYFKVAWERWKSASQPIGEFNSRLLMGLLYFTVMLPFGLLLKGSLARRLRLKPTEQNGSLWIKRDRQPDLTIEDARRQS